MLRKIVSIDEEKCIGCGLCIGACHEGALELVDGKAKLVKLDHCDGLGNCLPECPTEAISIIEKDFPADSQEQNRKEPENPHNPHNNHMACGCPGTLAKSLKPELSVKQNENSKQDENNKTQSETISDSELRQWPVQLRLVNSDAQYLAGADLLLAADCTAYAYAGFHQDFMKNRITLIGCPKLDDNEYNTEKIAEILKKGPKSITMVRMNVPCCAGLEKAVKEAMLRTKKIVPYREVVITPEGQII